MLANFCFLSSGDNQKIKNKNPKTYKDLINPGALKSVMERAICSNDSLDLTYDEFISRRLEILTSKANEII